MLSYFPYICIVRITSSLYRITNIMKRTFIALVITFMQMKFLETVSYFCQLELRGRYFSINHSYVNKRWPASSVENSDAHVWQYIMYIWKRWSTNAKRKTTYENVFFLSFSPFSFLFFRSERITVCVIILINLWPYRCS